MVGSRQANLDSGNNLPIISGVWNEMDIIVNRKTVLSFLSKPLQKGLEGFAVPGEYCKN